MARHWEGCEWIRTGIGSRGLAGHVCWFLGAVFAVLGIIGDAANATLGLEPMAWLGGRWLGLQIPQKLSN